MSLENYKWILILVIEILKLISAMKPDEKASLAKIAKEMQKTA